MKYIDVHAHLHDKAFDEDRDAVLAQMKQEGIGAITVGTDFVQSEKAVALAEKHTNLWATVGFHPVDNKEEIFDVSKYEELARNGRVVAIGECGLDYYWPAQEGALSEEEKEKQRNVFRQHIELAIKVNKPLMLHGRPSKGSMDAYEDMLVILETYKDKVKGNAHFFAGTVGVAKRFLDIGFTMSFPGVITFAKELEETVAYVPLENMHGETDSPYASPVPFRGKRNSPLHVPIILKKIAEIKGEPEDHVKDVFLKNVKNIFNIDIAFVKG